MSYILFLLVLLCGCGKRIKSSRMRESIHKEVEYMLSEPLVSSVEKTDEVLDKQEELQDTKQVSVNVLPTIEEPVQPLPEEVMQEEINISKWRKPFEKTSTDVRNLYDRFVISSIAKKKVTDSAKEQYEHSMPIFHALSNGTVLHVGKDFKEPVPEKYQSVIVKSILSEDKSTGAYKHIIIGYGRLDRVLVKKNASINSTNTILGEANHPITMSTILVECKSRDAQPVSSVIDDWAKLDQILSGS